MMPETRELDVIAVGRSSLDLYAHQIGCAMADVRSFDAYIGGCALNVSVGTRRLGLRSVLLTAVGDDQVGDFIVASLDRERVETRYIPRKRGRRTSAVVLTIQPPDRFPLTFYRDNCADRALTADDVANTPIAGSRVVFVTGMERGLVPISHADNPAALAEERRLLHVAITRSREHLHLTWAERRTVGGRDASRKPSPYLAAIEDAIAGRAPQPASPRHAKHALAKARDRLALVGGRERSPADARLFDALVAWRRELARAAKVPAYVIFNDATLAAVAGSRPTTHRALLALPGIGPVKVERYGEAFLEALREA